MAKRSESPAATTNTLKRGHGWAVFMKRSRPEDVPQEPALAVDEWVCTLSMEGKVGVSGVSQTPSHACGSFLFSLRGHWPGFSSAPSPPPSPVCEGPPLVLWDTMCIYERGFTWTRVGVGAPGSVRSGGAGCGGGISCSLVMSHDHTVMSAVAPYLLPDSEWGQAAAHISTSN